MSNRSKFELRLNDSYRYKHTARGHENERRERIRQQVDHIPEIVSKQRRVQIALFES